MAGERKFDVTDYHLFPGKTLSVNFEWRVVATDVKDVDKKAESVPIDWAEFWAALDAGEKTALGTIKTKLQSLVKSKVPYLANATPE